MNEFSRMEKMLGKSILNKLNGVSVLVCGLGGVGGITFEMLVRSGVGNIILVDYDIFETSNLNRQILCLDNVGNLKTKEAKARAKKINPNCNIRVINKKIDSEFFNGFNYEVDYIIDAIDDVNAKVLLIKYALEHRIKIISSCGTGNRLKPELLKITNIWKTEYDPLAKKIRKKLREENITYKLPVVCSSEKPIIKSSDCVGSCALVPNAAGILLASYVINDIIK